MKIKTFSSYDSVLRNKNRTSSILRSVLHQNVSLIEGMNELMRVINTQHHLCLEFVHCGFERENSLKEQDRIAIYLIVSSQIKNILRNTTATTAEIHLAKNYDLVAIVIEDNGLNTDPARVNNSNAFRTVQNLVNYYKGQCNICFEPDKGTVLEVLINLSTSPA